MTVTFQHTKTGRIIVTAQGCTFDFITESFHSFLKIVEEKSFDKLKTLTITFTDEKAESKN